jgi:hypothetical protein
MGTKRGIRQGSPVSPLLANIFFDAYIDRPWYRRWAQWPLIRYCDDLLALCTTAEEAADAYQKLAALAASAGTPLKGLAAGDCICNLQAGEPVQWLGFTLQRQGDHVAIRVGKAAWDKLSWHLAEAHLADGSPLRASAAALGWLQYLAPCFPFTDHGKVISKLRRIAADLAFDELSTTRVLQRSWERAYVRWNQLYAHVAATMPSSLRHLAEYGGSNCANSDAARGPDSRVPHGRMATGFVPTRNTEYGRTS